MQQRVENLSVIIITLNNEDEIADCLAAVRFAGEVIVVDAGSQDDTVNICQQYADKVIVNRPWPGFGPQKNVALSLATKPWVLSIDADERVPDTLQQEIVSVVCADSSEAPIAYKIPRRSSFCGKFMRFSGWYPDYVLRLFHREAAAFSQDLVHESIQLNHPNQSKQAVGKLKTPLIHYSIKTIDQARQKMYRYAELGAKNKWKNGKSCLAIRPFLSSAWTFLRTYLVQRGLFDGQHGLVLACLNAKGTFIKYHLLRRFNQHQHVPTCGIIVSTCNWPQGLARLLNSIERQTKCPDEVIIADDGSGQVTRDCIEAFQASSALTIKPIWQADDEAQATQVARIRNKAIAAANTDLLIFIDGDCVLPNDFVANHYCLAKRGHLNAGNRVMLSTAQTNEFLQSMPSESMPSTDWRGQVTLTLPQKIKQLYLPLGFFRDFFPRRWKGVKTCNVAIFRQDLLAVNGFDEGFTGWGYEDSDLVIRLYRNGVKRRAARFSASVLHLWHASNIDTQKAEHNRQQLAQTLASNTIKVTQGIDGHIAKVSVAKDCMDKDCMDKKGRD
ncbi:glycosyltransferase family 2 protein [Ostreibacterium oceani]|uniref:Glycosyltransferase n=1 Tax=Ostreibacterium oceani TaxID=2654998 RepID=A0A6N7EXP7_9GAMM|nr:glycosyltransferase [Ostreibacterium oceani]MPV86310.1 glycosyltransferase [Ostreibacterium oceani]